MLFYIVDDDESTRAMLAEIIEDGDLGVVAGEAEDGSILDKQRSIFKKIDILLIDLLMPHKDGIETIQGLKPVFNGKTIMISQIESKELIEKAYSHGITYFIIKPINKIEVLSVIKNVIENIQLEKSIHNIYKLTENLLPENPVEQSSTSSENLTANTEFLLSEAGITGERGYQDLLDILHFLFKYEKEESFNDGLPPLKDIYLKMIQDKKSITSEQVLNREIKAAEQRIRRAINHSLTHFASLGLEDFMNPTFEKYAPKFFDFDIVQRRMEEIKNSHPSSPPIRVNAKKFILVLYFETKQLMS
jgi:two-component system response regulator YcbB